MAMKIPYKVSVRMEEYDKNYGAINLASLLSHAQSRPKVEKSGLFREKA